MAALGEGVFRAALLSWTEYLDRLLICTAKKAVLCGHFGREGVATIVCCAGPATLAPTQHRTF